MSYSNCNNNCGSCNQCSCTTCTTCTTKCTCVQPCAPTPCDDGCLTDNPSKCVFLSQDIEICGTTYTSGTDLNEIIQAIEDCLQNGVPAANDIFVKISANDTTTGYLEDKIQGSDCLNITKQNIGGNEYLMISPKISAQPGNIIQCLNDGLYASVTQQSTHDPTIVLEQDTDTVDMTVQYNGTETYTVSATVRVCSDNQYADNLIQVIPGCGLYVPAPATQNPINIAQCSTSSTISQTVVLAGTTYTLCNEVNIPQLISTDANNCLVMGADGKLYVACANSGAIDMVTNVTFNGGSGELDFTGVGGAFSGSICLIDGAVDNQITVGPNGCLYVAPSTSQLTVTSNDTCPSDHLDDKFANPVSQLNPTGTTPGVGAFVWSGVGGDITCTDPNAIGDIISIVVNGTTYNNLSGLTLFAVSDIVATIQWIIDNNPALSGNGDMASSSAAGQPGIPPNIQDVYYFGFSSATVQINYRLCSDPTVLTVDLTNTYDDDIIANEVKIDIYKRVIDDGSGCESIEFFGYESPVVIPNPPCPPVLSSDLFGNIKLIGNQPYLELTYNGPALGPGEFIRVRSVLLDFGLGSSVDSGGYVIGSTNDYLIPLSTITGINAVQVLVERDCGCCDSDALSNAISVSFPVNLTTCDTNGWIDVPTSAMLNGWSDQAPNLPATSSAYTEPPLANQPQSLNLQYRIDGGQLRFRGSLYKNQTFGSTTTGDTIGVTFVNKEDVLDMSFLTCFDFSGQDMYGTLDVHACGVDTRAGAGRDDNAVILASKMRRNGAIFEAYQHLFFPHRNSGGSAVFGDLFVDLGMSSVHVTN